MDNLNNFCCQTFSVISQDFFLSVGWDEKKVNLHNLNGIALKSCLWYLTVIYVGQLKTIWRTMVTNDSCLHEKAWI